MVPGKGFIRLAFIESHEDCSRCSRENCEFEVCDYQWLHGNAKPGGSVWPACLVVPGRSQLVKPKVPPSRKREGS